MVTTCKSIALDLALQTINNKKHLKWFDLSSYTKSKK